jgi:hypothetical protein
MSAEGDLEITGQMLDAASGALVRSAMTALTLEFKAKRWREEYIPPHLTYVDADADTESRFRHRVPRAYGAHALARVGIVAWAPTFGVCVRSFTVAELEELGSLTVLLEKGPYWTHTVGVKTRGSGAPVKRVGTRTCFQWRKEVGSLRDGPPPREERLGPDHFPRLCLDGFTSEDGVYRGGMPDLQEGVERVELEGPGFFGPPARATREGPCGWNVELDESAQVLVHAQDPSGAPAPDATVWVHMPRGGAHQLQLDANGQCRGSGLAGTVRFVMRLARPDLPVTPWKNYEFLPDLDVVLDFAPGEDRVVALRPEPLSATLECRVLTAERQPAAGTPLWLARDVQHVGVEQLEVSVDNDGVAQFGSLTPGRYKISENSMTNSGNYRWKLELAPGEQKKLELTVERRTPVQGVVREAGGGPAALARVSAFDFGPSGFGVSRSALCDEDGSFALGPLRPGPIHVSVFHGRHGGPRDFTVENDGRPLEITLDDVPPPIVVWGSIAESSRAMATGEIDAIVVVGGEDPYGTPPGEPSETRGGRTVIQAYSRGSGHVKADGTFSIEIGAMSPETDHMEKKLCLRVGACEPILRVMPAGTRELELADLVLERGVTLRGRVEDAAQCLARGGEARVTALVPIFGECLRADVGPDGSFVLRGVPAEPITIQVTLFPPTTVRERVFYEGRTQVDPTTVPDGDVGVIKLERVERELF